MLHESSTAIVSAKLKIAFQSSVASPKVLLSQKSIFFPFFNLSAASPTPAVLMTSPQQCSAWEKCNGSTKLEQIKREYK